MLRSPAPPIINGGGPFPFSMCLTCPPYPHQHFEHYDHYQLHQNAHNHHLSQASFHQQQHHLNAPAGGGNSSGPPSVESGGTASTGSTGGGGGVTAITTLGRSGKHYHHSHHHHHHHSSHHHNSSHHTKSHRSSSTGSSGSRHLQENSCLSSTLLIEPNLGSLTKTSTLGRTKRSVQPPGSLPMPKQILTRAKKDSSNVLASLLPGMSFTLPAQFSLQKQTHHHHHHHHRQQQHPHHHQQLLLQQQALSSLSNSSSGALSLPPSAPNNITNAAIVSNNSTASAASTLVGGTTTGTSANGRRSSSGGSSGATSHSAAAVASASLDKHSSLVAANNGSLAPVITTISTTSSAQQKTTTGTHGLHQQQQSSSVSSTLKPSNHGSGHHRERNSEDDSPPPLPPKSPRIASKPARPHDFPQQLQLQLVDPSSESSTATKTGENASSAAPPPPPRRQSQKESQTKYLRLLQEQSANKIPHAVMDPTQSMTLPSPILPPTPPPDVVMESPMSDSGPIISPPPAFSTPVTPMIDRQNSTTSDKSGGNVVGSGGTTKVTATGAAISTTTNNTTSNATGRVRSLSQSTSHYHNITGFSLANTTVSASAISNSGNNPNNSNNVTAATTAASKPHSQAPQQSQSQNHYHTPLSGTVSMSAISSVNGRAGGTTRNNKSIPDLSSSADISLRYSPMSRSRSNSSPMSPEGSNQASSPDDDDDDEEDDDDDDADEDPTSSSVADNGHDGDDDCSERGKVSTHSPKIVAVGTARRNKAKFHPHHLPQQQQQQQQHQQQPQTLTGKVTLIPKSVTENFLYKVSSNGSANVGIVNNDAVKTSSIAAQTDVKQEQKPRHSTDGNIKSPSPARRPILRSKSDLSHRYAKAEKSGSLTPGFTLVHVDLGIPPPLPMHNSVSTNDFPINTSGMQSSGGNHKTNNHYHHLNLHHHHHHSQHQHHIYQTPNLTLATRTLPSTVKLSSHYHEPHNPHLSEGKRTTKSAGDLEKFFDMLGLESATPASASFTLSEFKESSKKIVKSGGAGGNGGGNSDSPVFFSSVSSVDSAPRRSGSADSEDSPLDDKLGSRTVGGYGKFGAAGGPTITVQHGEPSIVERNARVIKWLFNCRKAMERR